VLNYGIIRELYSQIARDMEGSVHDVIGTIANISTWKKRVSRFEVLPDVAEDGALWRCLSGPREFDTSLFLSSVKQAKKKSQISHQTLIRI
jgi:hypothetical protein